MAQMITAQVVYVLAYCADMLTWLLNMPWIFVLMQVSSMIWAIAACLVAYVMTNESTYLQWRILVHMMHMQVLPAKHI